MMKSSFMNRTIAKRLLTTSRNQFTHQLFDGNTRENSLAMVY